ncbi:tRNA lysidine(34) synthetase TilS [Acinetobacter sp. ANC 3813]|uniref:tRNA lysidine(34) synthetase TilS n=1 Tax=Acinetobacter sp. ANC 3813 TaxID=1977873 RepID=UPI000A3352D8|nr:tRNA lysidine(34) synthetase TilS [Acinetobacter sp. ANC 3813]OTG89924.1 tRNA lysidine(34) synthetase TilS [Acinetobacter sp. ANC 3813]
MRSALPAFNEIWQRQFRSDCLSQSETFSEQASFLIGCSGGVDSMLLLRLMSLLYPQKIRAIYIDHQLQAPSADWGRFVAESCALLNVPCIVQKVAVAEGNLENQARSARYQAYQQHLSTHEILVLAHHQQDQAETLILRLLSGAGIHGLAAMRALDQRDEMTIWRPMLNLSREQICQWAAELNVQNIQDPSNFNIQYDRAWARAELWPMLQSRYPKMQLALSRSSALMQDAEDILADVLAQDMVSCGTSDRLQLEKLQALSLPRQRQLLSAWMKGQEQYRPSFDMVQRLMHEVIDSKMDSQAALHCNGFYYLRFSGGVFRISSAEYMLSKHEQFAMQTIQLHDNQLFKVLSGQFQIQYTETYGLSPTLLCQNLSLVQRQGGEKIHLHGRSGSWPLKKAIQQAQIFPWLRHRIQILSIDDVMLGVFTPKGFWLAESPYCVAAGWQPQLVSSDNRKTGF